MPNFPYACHQPRQALNPFPTTREAQAHRMAPLGETTFFPMSKCPQINDYKEKEVDCREGERSSSLTLIHKGAIPVPIPRACAVSARREHQVPATDRE